RASGKTSAWMANGDRMPSRASVSTTGALTPSAVNDGIKGGSFRVKRGSRCERLETPANRRNEKLDLRAAEWWPRGHGSTEIPVQRAVMVSPDALAGSDSPRSWRGVLDAYAEPRLGRSLLDL